SRRARRRSDRSSPRRQPPRPRASPRSGRGRTRPRPARHGYIARSSTSRLRETAAGPMSANSDHAADWRAAIRELAAFDRPSASDGERRGAELIAGRLRELGCRVEIEEERAHGGYWWPIGLVNAFAVATGAVALRRRGPLARAIAAGVAGVGAAAL